MVTVAGFLAPAALLLAVLGVTALARLVRDWVRAANHTIATLTEPPPPAAGPLPIELMPSPAGQIWYRVDLTGGSQTHLWLNDRRRDDAP